MVYKRRKYISLKIKFNAHYKSVLFVGCLFANVCRQARADTCTLTKVHTKTNMHTNKLTEKHIKITQIYTCTKSSKTDKITHEHEHTNIQTRKKTIKHVKCMLYCLMKYILISIIRGKTIFFARKCII